MSGEEDFDLFGDDGAEDAEYEKMMAEKKAIADKKKEDDKKKNKAPIVLKSVIVMDVKPADSEVHLTHSLILPSFSSIPNSSLLLAVNVLTL